MIREGVIRNDEKNLCSPDGADAPALGSYSGNSRFRQCRKHGFAGCAGADSPEYFGGPFLVGPRPLYLVLCAAWDPDKVYVSVWKSEVFDHPDNAEAFLISTSELPNEKIDLMPDCVYRFRAVWELDSPDDEIGEADYDVVTEQMTDAERTAAEARSSKPFSEADLRFLTLTIEGVDCVLGTTTPQDLINAGFYCYIEPDGCVSIITQEDPYGYIYAYTADDRMDSPILSLNAFWAYDVRIEYCGVVWHDEEENPEDEPEDDWADDVEGEPVDDDEPWGIWAAMAPMTDKPFYVEESVEGISSTVITLSNGREVSVSEHSSPVSLSLLPVKGTQSKVRDF